MATMVGMFGDHISTLHAPAGLLSLSILFILSITLIALCLKCKRNNGNAYDVNGAESGEQVGSSSAKTGVADSNLDYSWRDHKDMPESTLERS